MRLSFRFRWVPFIAVTLVVAVGVSLGNWQLRRAEQKLALQQQMSARAEFVPVNSNALTPAQTPEEFRRVVAEGEFISSWAVYLDNRPYQGRAGFYLLMPFKLAGSEQSVLVMRGWFPRDSINREHIPTIAVPEGVVDAIRAHEAAQTFDQSLEPARRFKPGMAVRVTGGPFADLIGKFQALADAERVIVLLDLLGREVRVHVPNRAVAAA
jgi:cytochrome oxidase assembly protein ShyY1